MAALRNLAICALRLSGRADVTEATRWASRSMDRPFTILGLTGRAVPAGDPGSFMACVRQGPYHGPVQWRITFFVNDADRTPDGWTIRGEAGLGPPEPGDEFSFVQHRDHHLDEDRVALRVMEIRSGSLRVSGGTDIMLRQGDILGGEVKR
jgi:hypothetical protein